MKSSKMENILNYNPTTEDSEAMSPLTYYHPFQSKFDTGFAVQPRQNPPQFNLWGAPEGPSPGGGNTWDNGGLSIGALPTASTSTWSDPERRSLCNSTWLGPTPGALRSPTPLSPLRALVASSGTYSQYQPKNDTLFGGFGAMRPGPGDLEGSSTRAGAQTQGRSGYYPLMFSPLGRTMSSNVYKPGFSGHTRPMMCNFCKNNKEVPDIYLNHYLYDPETKVLSCPVLRKHVCEVCGGTGDQAHTLQYCPVNRERGLQAKVPVLLKARTITNSTGKIRRN